MKRATPSKDLAKQWLRKAAEAAVSSSASDLPPIRVCARCAGVALVTMQKAARELHDEGLLWVRPGSGIHIRSQMAGVALHGTGQGDAFPVRLTSWRHIERELAKRVTEARYDRGALLPSFKKLCAEFSVGYESVKKALESLVDSGVINRSGRKYRVPAIQSTCGGSSVALIISGLDRNDVGLDDLTRARVSGCLHAVETECLKAGLRLYIIVFHINDFAFYLKDYRIEMTSSFIDKQQMLGIIYWPMGTDERCFEEVMKKLAHVTLPVATVTELPAPPVDISPVGNRMYFISNDACPGQVVGEYLYNLGHRDVAYIEAAQKTWSQKRVEGLKSVLNSTTGGKVAIYSSLDSDEWFQMHSKDNRLRQPIESFIRDFLVREELSTEDPDEITNMRHKFSQIFYLDLVRERLYGLLDTVAKNLGHTVWVCQNDLVALMALRYLGKRRIPVPERISVIGFDDLPATRVEGLTTYDFNLTAYVNDILDYILNRSHSIRSKTDALSFQGFVVERLSVRTIGAHMC